MNDELPDNDDEFWSIGFFGPPQLMKSYERPVETPIGQPCILCDEAVAEADIGTIDSAGRVTHYECQMRGVIGSVGHQQKRCSCYGGTEEDPPGMSRRQAALAAVDHFYKSKPWSKDTP